MFPVEFNDSVLILQSNTCDVDLYGQMYSVTLKKIVQGISFFTVKTDTCKQTGKSLQAHWLFTKEHRVEGLVLAVEER